MNQLKLSQIRDELSKIKDFDSLKSEIKKLITEIDKFDFKKSIPEEKLKFIEQKYSEIMKTIQTLQTQVESEYDRLLKKVKAGRKDAVKIVKEARSKFLIQRKELESIASKNFKYFSKKAKTTIATEEKALKKKVKKIKKTAVAKAKKTFKTTNTKPRRVTKKVSK